MRRRHDAIIAYRAGTVAVWIARYSIGAKTNVQILVDRGLLLVIVLLFQLMRIPSELFFKATATMISEIERKRLIAINGRQTRVASTWTWSRTDRRGG
jgi:hypothetical protein